MAMDANTKKILAYIGVGLGAALIVGLLVWMAMAGSVSDANDRADALDEQLADLESQVTSLTTNAEKDADDVGDDADADDDADDDAEPADPDSVADDTADDGRFFCFVRDVQNVSGTTEITVDYAEMLTWCRSGGSRVSSRRRISAPNDYFISNVNPMLRTFPVEAGIQVELVSMAEGVNTSGYTVVLGQWHDFFIGMSPGMEVIQHVPYWIEVEHGVVTAIEEQYIP